MVERVTRRGLIEGALATALVAPLLGAESAAAQVALSDDEYLARYVHPELRVLARQYLGMGKMMPDLTAANLPMMRRGSSAAVPRKLASPAIEKRQIPGAPGQPAVTIHVVNAKAGTARPAILHMHGGGYIIGDAGMNYADLQGICQALDCVAVSVDYRLAPETTYRGSVEDNYAALKWLHANAATLGADPARIAVMGESAGGGHAALLAITARDRGEVPVCFQCLTYPMLDDRTGSTRPAPPHVGKILWTAERNRFGWESFLGTRPGGRSVRGGVPARVANLAGLPPAWIGVGSIDLFHDEDVDYAQRLNNAGAATELIVVPGAFHGFDSPLFLAAISRWFIAARTDALRRGLGLPVA